MNNCTTPQPAFLGELRCRRPTETTSVSALGHPQNLDIPSVDFWQGNRENVNFISHSRGRIGRRRIRNEERTTSKIIDETIVHSVKIKRWKRCSSHHTALLVKDLACSLAGSTFSLSDLPNMGAGEHKRNKFFFFERSPWVTQGWNGSTRRRTETVNSNKVLVGAIFFVQHFICFFTFCRQWEVT